LVRRAEWIVDVGPLAGEQGGEVLYSGPPAGLEAVEESQTRSFLFGKTTPPSSHLRPLEHWLRLDGVSLNNLKNLSAAFPTQALTCVTGVSGSGKSSLVSQALIDLVGRALGHGVQTNEDDADAPALPGTVEGRIAGGMEGIKRLVQVDQKPIGRTPRSNLATYTGLFDEVRRLFAATKAARSRKYTAGRFSFNVAQGRCEVCQGEGFVSVELLFMPSVYAPCSECKGTRYNAKTLEIEYRGKNIAEVLNMTVGTAAEFFVDDVPILRSLSVLQEVGLSYLRLGQPATELSGGEAQRIKLSTELQRVQAGNTLYVLDEPTTGLHPSDVQRLIKQLNRLVDAGNTVVVVEHDLDVICVSDYIIDVGPGAGEEGGRIVATGTPAEISKATGSRTAPYLKDFLRRAHRLEA
jgi:excinuclease ABC subunit A